MNGLRAEVDYCDWFDDNRRHVRIYRGDIQINTDRLCLAGADAAGGDKPACPCCAARTFVEVPGAFPEDQDNGVDPCANCGHVNGKHEWMEATP